MNDLINKILNAICEVYKKQYVGILKIGKLKPFGYYVLFGLNTPEKPVVIALLIEDLDKFITLFKKELRESKLHEAKYFRTFLNYNSINNNQTLKVKILIDNN